MATKSPLKTNLGRRVSKLIAQTPWAFSREGLALALRSQTASQKIPISSVDAILEELKTIGRIKNVNGNGLRSVNPTISEKVILNIIRLSADPIHKSYLMGHMGRTVARKDKIQTILENLLEKSIITEQKGFLTHGQPASNSALVKLSRNRQYANLINWQDGTISPYLQIPKNLSQRITQQSETSNTTLVKFSRTLSSALKGEEILPETGIVAKFTEVSQDTSILEPVDFAHKGTFRIINSQSPVEIKKGNIVLLKHFEKSSIGILDAEFASDEACYGNLDLFQHRKTLHIPKIVESQAERIAHALPTFHAISNDEKFLDLTQKPFFTVDPKNTQDIDDAICFEENSDGSMTVYVAIANVASQIPFESELDKYRRNNPHSIFLANGSRHTMPPSLYNAKNGALSLCEGYTRHALIHKFEIPAYLSSLDEIEMSVFPAVIKSRKAFSYSEFGEKLFYLETVEDVELSESMEHAVKFVNQLQFLISGLPFDSCKLSLSFNSAGELDNYQYQQPDISHQVIELAALLTNKKSTESVLNYNQSHPEQPLPLIFRVQGVPDKDELIEAIDRIEHIVPSLFGDWPEQALNGIGHNSSEYKDVARNLIESALMKCTDDLRPTVSKILLRSTRKARYSTQEQGHFSLDTVTGHFTSPLRRYVDTINQRSTMEAAGILVSDLDMDAEKMTKFAQFASSEEIIAKQIQSDSKQRFLIGYLGKNTSQPICNAKISCLREKGIVVKIDGVEGFISRTDLPLSWDRDLTTQTLYVEEGGRITAFSIGETLPMNLIIKEACPFKRSLKFGNAADTIVHKNWEEPRQAFA